VRVSEPRHDDPWSRGRQATRDEVRAIFARHAAAREAAAASAQPERRSPLPSLLALPAHGWRGLSSRGKVVVAALGAALFALAVALVPPALETASRNEANERAAVAANRARIRRELIEEQRPRRALLDASQSLAPALAEHVRGDARRRALAGTLEGPIGNTSCERITRTGEDPRYATFSCLVERGGRGTYRGRDLLIGYRFRGRVELASGRAAWCKEHPRPLHPDTEEFVTVPVSRACTG
jgi:hypothetical protein